MDRKISPSKKSRLKKWLPLAAMLVIVGGASYAFKSESNSLNVNKIDLKIGTVVEQEFLEFIPVRGRIIPEKTVYIDVIDGGRIEEIFVQEGEFVKAGQPILKLSSSALQLEVISREAEISEQINNLRNTRLAMQTEELDLKRELLDIDYRLSQLVRKEQKLKQLTEQGQFAEEEYLEFTDEIDYLRKRRALTKERQKQNDELFEIQVSQLEYSTRNLEKNLKIAFGSLENLTVKSPVSGFLTSLDAEIGESKVAGDRLAQVDNVDRFKITAKVDEFYISDVEVDQRATFELAGKSFSARIRKIYPQVIKGQFRVDFHLDDQDIKVRRGQSLQLKLALSDREKSILLPRGGFYDISRGNWIFVVNNGVAKRRNIKLGRANPNFYIVETGLKIGERVVLSSYEEYLDIEKLVIN